MKSRQATVLLIPVRAVQPLC
uniref:Uncharacterized protein n=1 Tax=Anguilla anguilla TaxID=7936 RepID=A0A0E9RG36_ANGAN